jgi:hypothetical protein
MPRLLERARVLVHLAKAYKWSRIQQPKPTACIFLAVQIIKVE